MLQDGILILDFGSQYTQLIARRIRELGVYSSIQSCTLGYDDVLKMRPKGLILSGGPDSVQTGEQIDPKLLSGEFPVLGICYGMQLMNQLGGGVVEAHERGEYGRQTVHYSPCPLFGDLASVSGAAWMSHRDSIKTLAPDFRAICHSDDGLIAAIQHVEKPLFGLQFHPEVTHSQNGEEILSNFVSLCKAPRSWNMAAYLEGEKQLIREKVGSKRVASLISGGVDSTVATLVCRQALEPDQVHAVYVDTGLMRENETTEVQQMMQAQGIKQFHTIEAAEVFAKVLKGVEEPEEKRRRIGDAFIEVLQKEMHRLGLDDEDSFLCQGTLYTDLIESGKGCGKHAAVIKSHHNVNPPIVQEKRKRGLIIEPNREIFKDEVRALGETLGMPKDLVWRHPFPGPGLAIRILGEVTPSRVQMLRRADAIYLEEIRKAGLYTEIWQAFAGLFPLTTVGVMGDQRTEGYIIALRAVTSKDGMTAESYAFPHDVLSRISTRIINEVDGVNRVVYDVTSKPPATIEWE